MIKLSKAIVISMLVLLVFAGCTANSENNNAVETKDPVNQQGKTEGEVKTEEPKPPAKITIAVGTATDKYVEQSSNINDDKWVKALEQRTNTDLDFTVLAHANLRELLSLMFVSGDIPDVVQTQQGMYPADPSMGGSVEAGVFRPLDALLKEYGPNLLEKIPQEAWDEVTYNNEIYAVPMWLSTPSRRGMFIRMDILEKSGLPVPVTTDDFMNMLRKFKGMGIQEPYGTRANFVYSDAIMAAYDVMPYNNMYEKQGDKVGPKFLDVENTIAALETWKTMLDEGLIAEDFSSQSGVMRAQKIDAGTTVLWEANVNSLLSNQKRLEGIIPEARLGVIPFPKGPDGSGGAMLYGSTLRLNYINAKVDEEKAVDIIKFLDWQVTEEGQNFFTFGIEGENYKVENDKIIYTTPVNDEQILEENYRVNWLPLVYDGAFNRVLLENSPGGDELLNVFDTITSKEGREGIVFSPPLKTYEKYPDLAEGFGIPSKLILDHMLKMIYGKEPISDWPKVIEEWKSKGGNEIIEEATARFNNKDGIIKVGKDANVN